MEPQYCDRLERAPIDCLQHAKTAHPFTVLQASHEGGILALFKSALHYGMPGALLQVPGIWDGLCMQQH
ncbi:hypothetical protein M404DRAFT_1001133 [Pisolithus tinctorius Marx 270]|uniref:Uncharacterized protein n=1 Tax=Pisolithus tinctorius Marx 270 TaxID=870435 RepID=A0A0C3NS17_PISTI|nr:hypothetical protein M404DRAFT_1001133 [Pisolithus tinctorius Marx 270]